MGHIPMGVGFKWVDDVGSPWPPALLEKYNLVPQGISAEMIADKWEIPRSELDEIGLRPPPPAPPAPPGGRVGRGDVSVSGEGGTYLGGPGLPPGPHPPAAAQPQPAVQEGG